MIVDKSGIFGIVLGDCPKISSSRVINRHFEGTAIFDRLCLALRGFGRLDRAARTGEVHPSVFLGRVHSIDLVLLGLSRFDGQTVPFMASYLSEVSFSVCMSDKLLPPLGRRKLKRGWNSLNKNLTLISPFYSFCESKKSHLLRASLHRSPVLHLGRLPYVPSTHLIDHPKNTSLFRSHHIPEVKDILVTYLLTRLACCLPHLH